jgi:hypothetical protein
VAAPTHTMSGSRFLRPKLSRFFNQVAQAHPKTARFVKGAAALMPAVPYVFSSRFFTQPPTPPAEATTTPPQPDHSLSSLFLHPKMLSRFFNQAAQPRSRTSRFMKGTASLIPPMPDIFSSQFYSKPRPPTPHLKPHWRPGKPRGPGPGR